MLNPKTGIVFPNGIKTKKNPAPPARKVED
jgi:hypothetical protein